MEEKWHELREIEAQRSDIIIKLKRIEEKQSTVSVDVYTKVKKDYEDKLKQINEEMAQHVDLIKNELASLKQEEEKVMQKEKEIKFKMEESSLRYSIGEYDEESFKKMRDENNKDMEVIESELQKLRERRKWLEDFVELKSIEETIDEDIEGAIEGIIKPATETVTPEKPEEEVKTKEEIEIEEHILEEEVPEEVAKLDELLVEEEAATPGTSEEQGLTPEPTEEPPKEKEEVGEKVPCPKCGHMNSPDSWYCEKCGAEILDSQQSL